MVTEKAPRKMDAMLDRSLECGNRLLDMWPGALEGTKASLSVLTELNDRRVQEMLIGPVDRLTSCPAASRDGVPGDASATPPRTRGVGRGALCVLMCLGRSARLSLATCG